MNLNSMRDPINIELDILRVFYDAWEYMHSVPNDEPNRKQVAAQSLIDAANDVRAFRKQQ